MSGYNRFEQAVGTALDRFPRTKSAVETTYQRLNYHLANRGGFEYDLHEEVEIRSVEEEFEVSASDLARFVGFYDICPWSPGMRAFLLHESEGNTTRILTLEDGSMTSLATTAACNLQQGSRLQWHPARDDWLLFNDVDGRSEVGRVMSLSGERVTTYPRPVHAIHPDGTEYLSTNFRRADKNSPGYGYGTLQDGDIESPQNDGIIRVSLDDPACGNDCRQELVVRLSELISRADTDVPHTKHYIHHILYSPDGSRFVFLHRWLDDENRHTELYVSDGRGNTERLLRNRYISHFCWLDTERLFLWGGTERHDRGYHILNTITGNVSPIDVLTGQGDGHPSLSPDGRWIVTDTYPDRARRRSLFLYNLETKERVDVGEFLAPFGYDGTNRCDLHPRWSPNGNLVSIDSTFTGSRRSYVVDVESIVR